MKISLFHLSKNMAHLAGATRGEEHAGKIMTLLAADGETLFIDFSGVESATTSYLKALLVPFYGGDDASAGADVKTAFPVLVRVAGVVGEDVDQLANFTGRPIVQGIKVRGEEVLMARVHGRLDPALAHTLATLVARGAATATDLHAAAGAGVAVTAWNNRLADLHLRRLAKRRRVGKQWIYEPIAREFEHG